MNLIYSLRREKDVGLSVISNVYRKPPKISILLGFGPSTLKSKSRSSPRPSFPAVLAAPGCRSSAPSADPAAVRGSDAARGSDSVRSLAEGEGPLPLGLTGPVGSGGAPARLGLPPAACSSRRPRRGGARPRRRSRSSSSPLSTFWTAGRREADTAGQKQQHHRPPPNLHQKLPQQQPD
jgi:hypothetical protein